MKQFVLRFKLTEKALLLYAGLCYLAEIVRTYGILRFPFAVEYGESTILSQVKTLFEGNFPYNKHLIEIHNYFSYTPLFQYLTSVLGSEPTQWLLSARLINSLGLIAVGILVATMYYEWKGEERKPIHWAAALLLWLSWYPVFNWIALARLDGLALFLQVLGLYLYIRPTRVRLWQSLAILVLILAFFTKQSAVWVAGAMMLYDLANRRFNPLWLIYFVGIALGLGILSAKSDGTLWIHLVGSNQNQFSLSLLYENLKANFVFHIGLIVMAVFAFYKMQMNKQNTLIVVLLIATIPYVVGIGREGSNVNFLLELCVPLTWLVLIAAEKLDKTVVGSIIGVCLIALPMKDNLEFRWNFLKSKSEPEWTSYSIEADISTRNVIQLIRAQTGEVWSEDISLPIFAGKEPTFFPFEFMQGMSRGSIDENKYVQMLHDRKVALIIIENRRFRSPAKRFTDRMLEEIASSYQLISADDYFFVYSPNTK